jgi:hypothetical protein
MKLQSTKYVILKSHVIKYNSYYLLCLQIKWINKQKVLVFSARGVTQRDRHLMQDIRTLMPHCKEENKMERKDNLAVINEVCML